MKEAIRQKTLDANTERAANRRSRESTQKPVRQQAPLKAHGQPAWRDVKEGRE